MNRSVKAALLSALVFPGAGQWYLGRRLRALAFAVPTLVAAGYVLNSIWDLAIRISAEIESGRIGLDPLALAERIHQQGAGNMGSLNLAALVMLGCWIASTAEALLVKEPNPALPR